MKKIFLSLIIMSLFIIQAYAFTPIDDRFENIGGVPYKFYYNNNENFSCVCYSYKPVYVKKCVPGDIYKYNDVEFDAYQQYDNSYFFYTDKIDGIYSFDSNSFLAYWDELAQNYYQWFYDDYRQFSVYQVQRSNFDIPEMNQDNIFIQIFFAKDSALNLLPITQNQLKYNKVIAIILTVTLLYFFLNSLFRRRQLTV